MKQKTTSSRHIWNVGTNWRRSAGRQRAITMHIQMSLLQQQQQSLLQSLLQGSTEQLNTPQQQLCLLCLQQLSLLQSSNGELLIFSLRSCFKTDAAPQVCLHALRCAVYWTPHTLTGNICPYQRCLLPRRHQYGVGLQQPFGRVHRKHQQHQ